MWPFMCFLHKGEKKTTLLWESHVHFFSCFSQVLWWFLFLMHLMLTEIKQLNCQFIEVRISPLPPQLAHFFSMAVHSCNSEVLGLYCAGWVIDEILCWVQSLLDPVCWLDCICGHLLRCVFMIEKGKLGNGSCFIIQPWDHLFLVTCEFFSLYVCLTTPWKLEPHAWNWLHGHLIAIGLCKL